ncbi:MAG: dihydroorotate dehydrogenase electron transfer subunit, partial [Candidatus Omnitrophica bacterium]|nr:dihydroorotate dehydrogenase electron transfer subunit [Candidatus Omnitrophota bacterium]
MLQVRAKIIYNKKAKGNYFHLALRAPQIAKASLPGQFLNIKVSDGYEPLLRRPLSVHRRQGTDIELLYEVVGKGTQVLSQRKQGENLDVIGPLGNGFDYRLPI